jgi:hypothetical protein
MQYVALVLVDPELWKRVHEINPGIRIKKAGGPAASHIGLSVK